MRDFVILNDDHGELIKSFSCVTCDDVLKLHYNSNERRKIKRHSAEIDEFLKNEALTEQKLKMNKTHLYYDDESNEIVGFVSLCNDSIPVEACKSLFNTKYKTAPALKIARLATNCKYQSQGVAKEIFRYIIFLTVSMRDFSGIRFLTLDCYKHRESFYQQFGFVRNEIQQKTESGENAISMFLHIDDYLESIG